jgi:hypothetical protein
VYYEAPGLPTIDENVRPWNADDDRDKNCHSGETNILKNDRNPTTQAEGNDMRPIFSEIKA